MRSFYVRRKDLDHVPFQFYVGRDGEARPLGKGYTAAFVIMPPKNEVEVVYVGILEDLSHDLAEQWDIQQGDLLRVAAKGVEAWLNDLVPADHVYGPEWFRIDRDWCPREPDGSPSLMLNPYSFQVTTDEAWPSILDWDFERAAREKENTESPAKADAPNVEKIVFGFTLDVFPGTLIVGYEQMKHKVAAAGLDVQVTLSRLDELPPNLRVLCVPVELADAARQAAPATRVETLEKMVSHPIYDSIIHELERERATPLSAEPA